MARQGNLFDPAPGAAAPGPDLPLSAELLLGWQQRLPAWLSGSEQQQWRQKHTVPMVLR